MAFFFDRKNDRQHTTIHHDSTTHLPSKNHVKVPIFSKPPAKTHKSPEK
jgi:hypothetical protein